MSRQRTQVTPLRGPASKLQLHASTTALSSGLRGAPELPPRNPPRNIGNGSTISARTGCAFFSGGEAEGLTHAKRNDRKKTWSGPTKAKDSSATAKACNQTFRQDDSALRLASASDSELLTTGKPMSLKEFSKGKSVRELPCLVKVVAGHHSLCERYSFGKEQMFVVLEKKSMSVVTCKDHNVGGSSYAVPLNTTAFHLVPYWMDDELVFPRSFGKITANELLLSKAFPPVVAVSEEFEVSDNHSTKAVPVGTLLFLKEKKQSKDWRQWVLHAKNQSGEMVRITPACNGRFSILARDVRLTLRQALNHLKPPFSMRIVSNCDTLFVNAVTVEKVHKEDVFIGMMKATEGTSIDDVSTFSRMAEVPVSLNLTIVTMVPRRREILGQIYDFVLAEYRGVVRQPIQSSRPADRVPMTRNPAYAGVPVTTTHMKATFSARLTPSVNATAAAPYTREEHIYDAVDNYQAVHTAAKQQMPACLPDKSDPSPSDAAAVDDYEEMHTPADQQGMRPSPEAAETLFGSDQPPSDAAAADDYEEMHSPANQQNASSELDVAGTLIKSDQPTLDATAVDDCEDSPANQQNMYPESEATGAVFKQSLLEENVPTSMKQDSSLEDTDANIAYLKKMQMTDILQLLDAMNLSAYKEAFEQEAIDGEMMSCLSADMLSELGVSKHLHRLRLMKIVSGETSASSFISISQFCTSTE